MNKKSMLARAVASGMLVANLAPIVLPSAHLVAGAISPSSYTQSAFDADMGEYKKKLAEYETKKVEYDRAKTEYDTKLSEYQNALRQYEARKAANQKENSDYQAAKAEYDRAKAAYDTAKAKYDQDKAAYDAAVAAQGTQDQEYQRKRQEYEAAMQAYRTKKAEYDSKKAAYDRIMSEAEANRNTDGYLATPTPQHLIFLKEPDAVVRIQGQGTFWNFTDPSKVGNAPGMEYFEASPGNGQPALTMTAPITLRISDNLESFPYVLRPGQSVTVEYTNIRNSYYGDKDISRVEYVITHPATATNDTTIYIMKDPTNGIVVADGDNAYFDGIPGSRANIRVRFFGPDGAPLSASAQAPMLLGLSSLNSTGTHFEKVKTNMEFMKINGSEVDMRPDGFAWATDDIDKGTGTSGLRTYDWDQADNPLFYKGGAVGKLTRGDTIEIEMRSTHGRQWMSISSAVSAKAVPVIPIPPVEPKPPTPPGTQTLTPPTAPVAPTPPKEVPPFTEQPPTPPTNPTPPVKPEMPIGPTSVTKSVSRDGNTFSAASTPADALDVGTQKDTWTWKLDFTLSNNTQYSSIVFEDSLENVQEVKESDVRVFDEFGKDVTEQGSVTKTSEGDKTIVRWAPNADRLGIINAESTRNNPEKLQRYSMTIRTTAANADGAALRRYMNADKMIVVPNVAKITVTGTSGNNPQNTVTEVSNTSHVKFKGENTVSNPEKKVTDLNERDVNSNHLGLVDRNQTYKISFDTGDGAIFGKLKIADSLPKGFTAKSDSIRITNTAGKDITSQFNVSLNGQELVATLKPEHATSTDLVSTKVTLSVSGTSVRWLGDTIKNTATVEDSEKTLKTNETVTVIPKDGDAIKEASLEETKGFTKSDQTPTVVPSIDDEYTWRNTFELPSRTNYTKVEVRDVFESVQAVDQGKIRVTDEAGADVTGLGTISVTKINDNQSEIKWVGGADYLSKLNSAHGKDKESTPKLVLSITTNVSEAQASQLNRYMTVDKTVVIPNVSSIMLRDDSGITTDYKMDTNVSKVSVPSVVDNERGGKPTKTVTDNDERDVAENRLGLTQTQQTYSITATTSGGHKLEKLVFTDQLPTQFKTDLSKVVITNAADEVVTDLFDLNLTPENALSAAVKEEAKADKRLIATEVTLKITGDLPKGLGTTITNTARVEDQRGGYDTGTVTTYVPSTPESVKSVSVDGGTSFVEAGELAKRSDEYIWKVDYKLANLTEYNEIVLSDELEGIQEVDRTKIKVFDYQGADITAQGKLDVKESGDKKIVTWTAGDEVISSINTKFGAKSKDAPSLSMTISTNVREAHNVQEAALYNAETGKVEIPNVAGLKITPKNDSTVEVKSNTPKVSLPTPGKSSAKKFVAEDGDSPQWSDKLQLANFDEVYQYRTEFKLAENFNFDEGTLTLTDIYEGIQAYDKVIVTDASGADISAKFDITSKTNPEDPFKVRITATPKRANDFDDKGETINLVIKGVKLTGASGHQLTNYLSTKDSEGGFHSGVTVPNVSTMTSTSTVPGQSQDVTSNKTYVNFDLEGRIEKSAEDELTQVVNPKDATSETPLADLVASAQKLITEPGKAKKATLEKLQAALTNPEITPAQLLTLLIEVSK